MLPLFVSLALLMHVEHVREKNQKKKITNRALTM